MGIYYNHDRTKNHGISANVNNHSDITRPMMNGFNSPPETDVINSNTTWVTMFHTALFGSTHLTCIIALRFSLGRSGPSSNQIA